MPKTPEDKIAALKAELVATQDAAAGLIMTTLQVMGMKPEQRKQIEDGFQAIADGRMRSRVTAVIARKVAEKMREGTAGG